MVLRVELSVNFGFMRFITLGDLKCVAEHPQPEILLFLLCPGHVRDYNLVTFVKCKRLGNLTGNNFLFYEFNIFRTLGFILFPDSDLGLFDFEKVEIDV